MSGGKAAPANLDKGKEFLSRVKDPLLVIGWVGGILLLGVLLWGLTQSLRTGILLKSVNKTLAYAGDSRRLEAVILPKQFSGKMGKIGIWYTQAGSENRMLIFSVMSGGILAPFAVEVSPQGKTGVLIPLNRHSEKTMDRLPPGTMDIYIRRIEAAGSFEEAKR
jgi:hypothetical protein